MATHVALLDGLRRVAGEICREAGLELVEMRVSGSSRNRVVRLDVDRAGPVGVDLGDCQRVSEAFGARLDESEVVGERYRLEVSSPGIDRPIRTEDDIRRNTGRRVAVTTTEPVEGRRSFRGVLVGADEGALVLAEESERRIRIPLDRIEKALQEAAF